MDVLRDLVLPKLDGIRANAGTYMARCPAHDDGRASLSLSVGKEHPVVLHCLAGETRVITREGTKTLAEMAGGVHELMVPGPGGAVWQKAPVSSFGAQALMKVTLQRFNTEKVLYATPEHRWFAEKRNGATVKEIRTDGLEPGMRLKAITARRRIEQVSSFGVAHGFTYGDGTLLSRGLGSQAQFCGAKDDALLSYFPHMKTFSAAEGVTRITGLPRFFKQAPPLNEAPAYLYGWLAGYFAADGSIEGPDGPAVISSANRESLEFVREVATRLGIVTYPIQEQSRNGYSEGPSTLYKVTLRALDLTSEFFILPSHRERWDARTRSTSYDTWRVVSVEATDRVEEVFCATVEGSHAFALEDNILTGNCHAGCDRDAILEAIGLTWADVCTPREERKEAGEWTPRGMASAVYDYVDEQGKLLFQVCRTSDKQFPCRVPDPSRPKGWSWKLGNTRRVLYRLQKVIEGVRNGDVIHIVEGEKDVHSLEAQRLIGTCNPGGASKWRPEYCEFLREADVTIISDRDEPGYVHARQVRDMLTGIAASVRIVEPAVGKDATDHFNAGKKLPDLVEIWTSEQAPKVDLAPDLWEFISVPDADYDWIVPDLIERGDRLVWTGFEGLGKSMAIRQMAVMIAAGMHPFKWTDMPPMRVLLIDCENSEQQSRRKFRPLAAASIKYGHRVPAGALRLIHKPAGIDVLRPGDADWLLERVTAHKPDILFVGPFYRLHAGNINDEEAARKTVAVLDDARTQADCALVVEAHAGHGEQGKNRSVRPVGSSLLLRWPEFGFGIAPDDPDQRPGERCRTVAVKPWRGGRDDRDWPTRLTYGGVGSWPWQIAPDFIPAKGWDSTT